MLPQTLHLLCLTIAGTIAGSFLSLVSQRYHPRLSPFRWLQALWLPASRCCSCGQALAWQDLIPVVSWLMLAGRCRYCQHPISAQPVLFEIICALIFIISGTLSPDITAQLSVAFYGCLLLLLTDIDRRYQRLPDVLTYLLLWSGLGRSLCQTGISSSVAILGALSGYVAFWVLAFLYRLLRRQEGLGYGDMKLFAALGAWSGWQALPLIAVIAASLAFGLLIILSVAGKTWKKEDPLPFGPFLAAAGWYVMIMPQPVSLNLLL